MPYGRWMVFVDGENLTIRAQEIAAELDVELHEGKYHEKNVFLWYPNRPGYIGTFHFFKGLRLEKEAERAYYFTCCDGDKDRLNDVRERLWSLHFHPEVFHKPRNKKAKAVDIALAKDFLTHAFMDNYDWAILVAGDKDYLPLIEEVKRRGKKVLVWFFKDKGLAPELKLAADWFEEIDIIAAWKQFNEEKRKT